MKQVLFNVIITAGLLTIVAAAAYRIDPEALQDWVGAMVSNNTESGINVTYDDATGTLDFTVTASGTGDVTTAQLADSIAYVRNTVAAVTAGATTIALDANSLMNRVFQVDMTSASTASTITLSFSNPQAAGVYTIHFQNVNGAGQDVDFPATFLNAAEAAFDGGTTVTYTAGDWVTCYFDGTNYNCK
jgi:hypothetical protein